MGLPPPSKLPAPKRLPIKDCQPLARPGCLLVDGPQVGQRAPAHQGVSRAPVSVPLPQNTPPPGDMGPFGQAD